MTPGIAGRWDLALEDQRDDDDDDDERPDAERDVATHGLIPFVDNECPNPPRAELFPCA